MISVLKNARFTGSGAKSWPRAFLPPGWSKLALNGAFIGLRLPKSHSKLQKSTNELKMSENGFRLEASDWEKSCFENGSCLPAEFWGVTISKAQRVQGAVLAASGRHSAFWELFWDVLWALQGGRACFESCFFGTLGRHSAFWKLLFLHFRAAQRVLEALFWQFAFERVFWTSQKSKISRHQNGGDFSTKKCSFYRVRRQILTEGLFTSWLIKISSKWSFYRSKAAKITFQASEKHKWA